VPIPVAPARGFDAAAVPSASGVPLDRGSALALDAARRALADAGLAPRDPALDADRLGVFWGSGMAGAATFDATCRTVYGASKRMRPTTVVTTMPNAPVAEIALAIGARGAAISYAAACASSAVAIGEAMLAIRTGRLDVCIAGGSEALLTPGVLASWQAMRVLPPLGASMEEAMARAPTSVQPFAAGRAGFALGEAAAALVLESESHAARRGAGQRHGVLAGYATNCDACHVTQPDPAGQARVLGAALRDASLQPGDIGHVNAHGTATMAGDAAEAASLAAVFGDRGVAVTSTKAVHGHLLGAAGAFELVATLRTLAARRLPPTAHVAAADAAFALDLVTGEARDAPGLRHALSSSFAFGGTNAVLVAARA
jgi:3-oxoacyl-[acyl-carrier-protein] synthase II